MKRALALAAILLTATPARAQGRDPTTAEALFDEGRRLMHDGKYAEACPKLEASQRLDPGVGTLLNLGDCYEKNGQTASAWARFREAAAAAVSAGMREREKIARDRAAALESKLVRMTILVRDESRVAGLEIKRDGVRVEPESWKTPVPVDPGAHAIEVTAPGRKAYAISVQIVANAKVTEVEIPPLADAPAPPAAPTPAPMAGPPSPPAAAESAAPGASIPTARGGDGATQRTLAIVALGVGVVGVGLGATFGILSGYAWDDAKKGCSASGCDAASIQAGNDAGALADVSTVTFVVGGAALAGAVVLWLTAPRATQPNLTSAPTGLGARF
jgi:serine/threonine-protein kinase